MPVVSLITPVAPTLATYLPSTAQSVADLIPVRGWSVEWLVVVDGETEGSEQAAARTSALATKAEELGADRALSNPARLFAGGSRNRALAHVTGEFCVALAADDMLIPTALQTLVALRREE